MNSTALFVVLLSVAMFILTIMDTRRHNRIKRGQNVLPSPVYWTGFGLVAATVPLLIVAIIAWK